MSLVESATGPALEAVVSFAGQATDTVTIDLATIAQEGEECPILNLELGPINLNLLGLHVDTSQICLDITAHEGEGLLGDLLCGLSGGLDLGGILGQLDDVAGQIETFIGQLDDLLDGVLGQALTVDQVFQNLDGEFYNIVNLSLGPVDLNLLGLNVSLDNCDDGPVTVDVTADPEGGLLGSLLGGLAGGPLGGLNLGGLVGRVDDLIDRLGDLAERLGDLPDVGRIADQVERLTGRLERLVERVDNLRGQDHILDRVEHIIDRLEGMIDRLD